MGFNNKGILKKNFMALSKFAFAVYIVVSGLHISDSLQEQVIDYLGISVHEQIQLRQIFVN